MKKVSYLELGGTLFVPASHANLQNILDANKYPQLKSVVVDFEDGLDESEFKVSHERMEKILRDINETSLLIFIRAKDRQHLAQLLKLKSINNITGFVLAKFSLENAEKYLTLLKSTEYLLMPSIEGGELFNHQKLHELKEIILTNKHKIMLVRFGLEDMLRQLSMRRKCDESIFDISATSSVIGNFISTFKSAGFGVSGGVYPCYKDKDGFIKDVKCDLKEGLFSKTIIHPSQIALLDEVYKVSRKEYDEALTILSSQKKVFTLNDKMAETLTMFTHSQELIQRAKIYGVSDE